MCVKVNVKLIIIFTECKTSLKDIILGEDKIPLRSCEQRLYSLPPNPNNFNDLTHNFVLSGGASMESQINKDALQVRKFYLNDGYGGYGDIKEI